MQKTKLVIIGSGPAGYTAGIYASRAQLEPILFTGHESGGQLMYTSELENFPGFPDGIIGPKFMMNLRKQAQKFGADIRDEQVTAVDFSSRPFRIWTNLPENVSLDDVKKADDQTFSRYELEIKKSEPALNADSIIISTGATSIMLGIPGEEKFFGRGVSTCAVCDAAFYRGKNVFVIGGGDSAMEDTMALTKFASKVTIVHRRNEFKASKIMQNRVINHPNVNIMWNSELVEIIGDETLKKIKIKSDGKTVEHDADGVFLAIGHKPVVKIFKDKLELDSHDYIVTRQSLSKAGLQKAQKFLNDKDLIDYPTMTSVEGVFAGGDVVDVRYKQAITAAGQGCASALDAEKWLENNK